LILDKGDKNRHWRKDNHFNKLFWENWISIYRRLKTTPYLLPYTGKNGSKTNIMARNSESTKKKP
jgi:hypothetical protein